MFLSYMRRYSSFTSIFAEEALEDFYIHMERMEIRFTQQQFSACLVTSDQFYTQVRDAQYLVVADTLRLILSF